MKAAILPDRGVVKVSGPDARNFLNGLITADLTKLEPGMARFGALLTPQGKIIIDFLITEAPAGHGGGFLIDCPAELAQMLTTKLGFYKLRAKVVVENLTDGLGVLAVWDGEPTIKPDLIFADPRERTLGWRVLTPRELAQKVADLIGAQLVDDALYEAHRITAGIPKGGADFAYSDSFPHEANMDRLHGVDFDKGCYVGQEVVSRMQHRGTARTRVVRVIPEGTPPDPGTTIQAGDKTVGTMGSSTPEIGLALIRLDRAADAREAGILLRAGDREIRLADPDAASAPHPNSPGQTLT